MPWNLTPAQSQSALEGLTSIGENNISVTGTAGVTYVCEFVGALGQTSLDLLAIDDTLVTGGGAVNVTIAQTTDGGTGTAPAQGNSSLSIDTIVLNTTRPRSGADRARVSRLPARRLATTVHTVTARTPTSTSPTTEITFTPALGAGTYADGGVLTFQPQQIEIKIGEGDLKYTEADQYKYDLDRGELDTVRRGDDVPMEVTTNFTFDQVKSGTGEAITPIEAIKGTGAASEWVTSSADPCEPYAVDVVVEDVRPCGGADVGHLHVPRLPQREARLRHQECHDRGLREVQCGRADHHSRHRNSELYAVPAITPAPLSSYLCKGDSYEDWWN